MPQQMILVRIRHLHKTITTLINISSWQVSVHYNQRNYITLVPGNLTNQMRSNTLTQFTIMNQTIGVSEDGNHFELKIMLQRMCFYHLTNTYLPTLTLLLIVEITLFFKESHLQVSDLISCDPLETVINSVATQDINLLTYSEEALESQLWLDS